MEIPVLNLWSSSNWIFLSFAYLTVAKLVQLRISVLYQISAWPQYSGFLSDLNLAPVFRFFIRSQLGPSIQVLYQISTCSQYSGSLSDLNLAPVSRFFIRSQLGPSIQVLYQISTWPQYSGSLSDLNLAPVFRFFIRSQLGPSIQVLLLVLDYKWPRNPLVYCRYVTSN